MPKATSVVSGVKFIPTFLSEGEAARIHFPTIVTDSVAGKTEITGADWVQITLAHLKSFTQVRQT